MNKFEYFLTAVDYKSRAILGTHFKIFRKLPYKYMTADEIRIYEASDNN